MHALGVVTAVKYKLMIATMKQFIFSTVMLQSSEWYRLYDLNLHYNHVYFMENAFCKLSLTALLPQETSYTSSHLHGSQSSLDDPHASVAKLAPSNTTEDCRRRTDRS